MKILTVSIAAFNVEKYLKKNLESFANVKNLDEIEILIINDGSVDKTQKIAKKYEEKYPESFKIISKENGGLGSTYNRSLREAKGIFYKTVDGDDWINPEGMEKLVEYLKICSDDLVVNSYILVDHISGKEQLVPIPDKLKNYKGDMNADAAEFNYAMHNITVRTDILTKRKIEVTENCFYVDVEYKNYATVLSDKFAFQNYPIYMYRINLPGQSVSIEGIRKHFDELLITLIQQCKFFLKNINKVSDSKKKYIESTMCGLIADAEVKFLLLPEKKENLYRMKEFDSRLKKYSKRYYELSTTKKITILRKTNFHLYKLLCHYSQKHYKRKKNE